MLNQHQMTLQQFDSSVLTLVLIPMPFSMNGKCATRSILKGHILSRRFMPRRV
jgi:hypothetical protein